MQAQITRAPKFSLKNAKGVRSRVFETAYKLNAEVFRVKTVENVPAKSISHNFLIFNVLHLHRNTIRERRFDLQTGLRKISVFANAAKIKLNDMSNCPCLSRLPRPIKVTTVN